MFQKNILNYKIFSFKNSNGKQRAKLFSLTLLLFFFFLLDNILIQNKTKETKTFSWQQWGIITENHKQ